MAPQNPKYSHLIIKEGDIEIVKYDPQGRTKPVPRNFGAHGQLLLDGMEHIITKHSTVTSSLGTNKVAFEIKLHESQKFQDKNRREFLENNKIRINAIKNQNQAIASAAITDFNKFENKVREYKNTSKNKSEFQFIDSITPIEIEEKQISDIKEVAKNTALKDEKFEMIMMSLRKKKGLKRSLYQKRFDHDVYEDYQMMIDEHTSQFFVSLLSNMSVLGP